MDGRGWVGGNGLAGSVSRCSLRPQPAWSRIDLLAPSAKCPPGAMFSAALGCLARALEATSDLRCGRHFFRTVSSMFPRRNQPACAVHVRALGEGNAGSPGGNVPSVSSDPSDLVATFGFNLSLFPQRPIISQFLNAIPAVWTRNRTPEYLIPILESQLG